MMNPDLTVSQPWSSGTLADAADSARRDLDSLGQHLKQCSVARSVAGSLRSGLTALHRSLLGRFVTSLGLMVAVVGVPLMWW
jgi:hypothetical protein